MVDNGSVSLQALLCLQCGGGGGALALPVDCSVTVEQALSMWTQCFQQHGISEPLLSSHYIIAHVLGKKNVSPTLCVSPWHCSQCLIAEQSEGKWTLNNDTVLTGLLCNKVQSVRNCLFHQCWMKYKGPGNETYPDPDYVYYYNEKVN